MVLPGFPSSRGKVQTLQCQRDLGSSPGTGFYQLGELDRGRPRNLPEPPLPYLQGGTGKAPCTVMP